MALDLAEFMKQRGLSSGVNLVGHSMYAFSFGQIRKQADEKGRKGSDGFRAQQGSE
jgi:hypothetical protein